MTSLVLLALLAPAAQPQATKVADARGVAETGVVAPRLSDHARRKSWINIGKFRRGAAASLGVGALGLAGAIGLQFGRAYLLGRCVRNGDPDSAICLASEHGGSRLRVYSAFGMAMMIAGSAGAGGFFGNADATRDVEVRGGKPKVPSFSKFTGLVTMGIAGAWAIGRNVHFSHAERRCDGDNACIAKVRPKRWLANDLATLAISLGAGFVGYSLAYERQARGLMALKVTPTATADHIGASISGSF